MSQFTTKKISHENEKKQYIRREINENIEKRIQQKSSNKWFQRITKILLILSSLLFIGIIGARHIAGINLGGNNTEANMFQSILSLVDEHTQETIVEEKKWVKNILIAGIGGKWEPGHVGSELTDSLMLVNLNFDTKEVVLLTLPRDLYVAYSQNTAWKLNALYQMGKDGEWLNMLTKKVSEITGQPIHYYAVIDFSGFRSIVNALGGIEIDVPRNLYDHKYPNNNWWYQIVNIKKWLQTMDGETALKYARSRYTTSDFDRSERQKLVIRAIKDKALSLGVLTNPKKIWDLVASIRNHLSTNLTIGDLANIGMEFADIKNENIVSYTINNECNGICPPGALLYQPPQVDYGNSWVLLPEGAIKSRLSRYETIRQFVDIVFTYPHINNQEKAIHIVTNGKNLTQARNLRMHLEKLGFPLEHTKTIVQTGAVLGDTRIISIHNNETNEWFDENHMLIKALKQVEKDLPVTFTKEREFTTGTGAVIEIIVGNDIKNFFKTQAYTPNAVIKNTPQTTQSGNTQSGTTLTGTIQTSSLSTNSTGSTIKNTENTETPQNPISALPSEMLSIQPGEWENFE